jgi:hypothetical protein
VQHERQPLGRRQRVQHNQQRQADRVRQHCLVFGVEFPRGLHNRIRQMRNQLLAPLGAPVTQRVQADPGHHRGEPGVWVRDTARGCAAQPQPGLLHRVLGVVDRAQHPVGEGTESGPGILEACRQPRTCGHRPPASGSAQTRLPENPADPMSSATLKRARRLPSVTTWVSATS